MLDKMSMEVRLLIAFVLMGLVLFVTPYVLPQPPKPAASADTSAPAAGVADSLAKDAKAPVSAANAEAPATPITPAAPLPGQVSATQEETVTVDTDLHHVVFSNRGAVVKSWTLKAYKDSKQKPLDLVNARAALLNLPAPMSLAFKTQPANNPNDDLYRFTKSADGLSVTFEFSDGRTSAKKSFEFTKDTYLAKMTSQVIENGVALPHSLVWRGGFGDSSTVNPVADAGTLFYDIPAAGLTKKTVSDASKAAISSSGQYAFAGIEDKYFTAVVLPLPATGDVPATAGTLEVTTYSDNVPKEDKTEQLRVGVAMGGSGTNALELYVGPKDMDTLRAVDPRLDNLIDWGWFWFIAKPLFYALTWISARMTHNYGWAIIVGTIILNTILFPLRLSSMKSSKKMAAMKPQVDAVNAKYAGMSAKDPRKAEQNQELMELYSKNGVNPVGGCIPMLFQIPVFYALYKVLSLAIEMRGAEWLWVSDISQPETLAIRVLPVVMVVSQFLTQKMTPQPGVDPTQQKMMLFMPLMFGYIFYYQSAGLVLYYLTSNLVSVVQQLILNRTMPTPAAVAVIPVSKKKK